MVLQDTFTLSNGVEIPQLGLGTWMIDDDNAVEVVKKAIEIGYRHIDTAQAYQNERGVGEGIKASGVDRADIFVTSKIDAEIKSYDDAVASIDETLTKMGLDYIDMMIIHSPKPWQEFHGDDHYFEGNLEVWKALEEAHEAGKVRAIGVSNFEQVDLENLIDNGTVKPIVNQILTHISNTPKELIEFSKAQDILVEAYSPIAHGELMKNEKVTDLAEKYSVSVPQLGIRYVLQLGLLPLPKTTNPDHMQSNAEVDFVINDEDMAFLLNIEPIEDYGEASMFPVYGGEL